MIEEFNNHEKILHCPVCGSILATYNEVIGGYACSSDFVDIGKPCRVCQEAQDRIIEDNRLENEECY